MVKSEKKTSEPVWLRLRGYHVTSLKPEFSEHVIELERAIREGIAAYSDPVRTDFYDVALEAGWAYIHVHGDGRVVYLVAHSLSMSNSFSTSGFGSTCTQFHNHAPVS